jgi:surface protein
MTLGEYYNFPSGIEPKMKYIPHWLEEHPNFPCLADMKYAFYQSKISTLPLIDTSNVTDMSYMFAFCTNLTSVDLSGWDTSKVTSMGYMFNGCSSLTEVDLSGLDTSKVTSMQQMFSVCSSLTEIVLSGLDTSNVKFMDSMFNNCRNLTSVDVSGLDTSKVTTMNSMFNYCTNLKSISSINCSGISTKNYYPIYNYSELSDLTDVGGFLGMKMSWDNTYGLVKCPNLTYESCINILNGLYDFTGNNQTPTSSQGKLKVHQNFLTLVGDEINIGTNKGWTITS